MNLAPNPATNADLNTAAVPTNQHGQPVARTIEWAIANAPIRELAEAVLSLDPASKALLHSLTEPKEA